MTSIELIKNVQPEKKVIELPGSKSETNRAYIIQALAEAKIDIINASQSEDSLIIANALQQRGSFEVDCRHSGAALRFLAAYFSCNEQQEVVLRGSARLQERPLRQLVDALRKMGADIEYLEQDGYAPIKIRGKKLNPSSSIELDASPSSQFLSALLLIAPVLENGLRIQLKEDYGSKPYVEMTIKMLQKAGIKVIEKGKMIHVPPQKFKSCSFEIEADWSSASYWYAMVSLGMPAVELRGLREDSLQGDAIVRTWMDNWDVESTFISKGLKLEYRQKAFVKKEYDFSNCPDLAQTFMVLASAKQRNIELRGIESLKHKESNRILAMQEELRKFFIEFKEKELGRYQIETIFFRIPNSLQINTHADHRIALSFACLSLLSNVKFDDHMVVQKSYPEFWKHLKSVGIMSNIEQYVV